MSMTRAQLRQAVITNTNRSDRASSINDFINQALDEITARHSFRNQRTEYPEVTLSAGENTVPFPEGLQTLGDARVKLSENSYAVIYIKAKKLLEVDFPALGNTTLLGTPLYGYVEGRNLVTIGKASQDYVLVLTGDSLAGQLNSDSDSHGLALVDQTIVAFATWKTFQSIQQWPDALQWERTYEKQLTLAIRLDKKRPAEERVVSTDSSSPQPLAVDPVSDPFYGL